MSQNEDETKVPEENPATETEVGATDAGESNPFTSDLKGEFTSSFGTETNTVSQLLSDGAFGAKKNKIIMAAGAAALVLAVLFLFMNGGDDGSSTDEFGNSDDTLAVVDDGDAIEESDSDTSASGDETEDLITESIEVEELSVDSEEAIEEEIAEERAEEQAVVEAEERRKQEAAEGGDELASVDAAALGGAAADGMTGDAAEPTAEGEMATDPAMVDVDQPVAGLEGTEVPVNLMPASGSSRSYDETSEYAEFSWEGSPGGYIYFSRNPSMNPIEKKSMVSGNSYRLRHPWPGTWYWKVANGAGASETASFTVDPAVRRNVVVNSPQSGATFSGNGGVVSWTGDTKVARYKVEVSQSGWANPDFKFQTSGNDVQVQGVPAGSYQIRVGAFSEVSGRWEFSQPMDVTVQ